MRHDFAVELLPCHHVLLHKLLHGPPDGGESPPDKGRKKQTNDAYPQHRLAIVVGGDGGEDNTLVQKEEAEKSKHVDEDVLFHPQ